MVRKYEEPQKVVGVLDGFVTLVSTSAIVK